jgi:hypothetical protein
MGLELLSGNEPLDKPTHEEALRDLLKHAD